MTPDLTCPDCGEKPPSDAPQGLCPTCLLRVGLEGDTSETPDPDASAGSTSVAGPGWGLAGAFEGPGPPSRPGDGQLRDEAGVGVETVSVSPAGPSVLDSLDETPGGVPLVRLRDLGPEAGPDPDLRAGPPEQAPTVGRPGKYRLFGEIARGGMGAILRARDPELGRELAIKVLLDRHRNRPELVRRFVEEAQVGGQLQHPGIVPVYELGTLPDRRPFFAMKLVKGRTLAELLAGRRDPSDDLSRFLSVFEQVCQTIAYVHSRGVIHRDLKPANVMVGSFGEVQVMDWGLARVLHPVAGRESEDTTGPGPGSDAVVTVRSGSEADASRAGTVMGTPAYMAPEQARGQPDPPNECADVFGLGAILCEILTGRPPFVGRDTSSTLALAARGDLSDAFTRLDACGTDPELAALARRCLAPVCTGRPRDAGEVASGVSQYLASVQERLRLAELARAEAQARAGEEEKRRELADDLAREAQARAAHERRARRLSVTVAAMVLGLVVLAGGAWVVRKQQRAIRIAEATRALNSAVIEATGLRGQARAAARPDLARLTRSVETLRRGLDLARDEADPVSTRDARALIAGLETELEEAERAGRDLELVERLADVVAAPEDDPEGLARDATYGATFRESGYPVDEWPAPEVAALIRSRPRAVATELASFLDEWAGLRRSRKQDPERWRRPSEVASLADPDEFRDTIRAALQADDPRAEKSTLLRLASDTRIGSQPAGTVVLLADALAAAGERSTSETLLRRAQRAHPGNVWVSYRLAERLEYSNPADAIVHFTMAQTLRPETGHKLGHLLERAGKGDEAIAVFEGLTRLRPRVVEHHDCLGAAFRSGGRAKEAQAAFERAVSAGREGVRIDSTSAYAHFALAEALDHLGDTRSADAEYRVANRLNPRYGESYESLTKAYDLDSTAGSLACDGHRMLARLRPDDPTAHYGYGLALAAAGDFGGAKSALSQAVRLKPDFAAARYELDVLRDVEIDPARAVVAYKEAIHLRPDVPRNHFQLGLALERAGDPKYALAEFREAVRLNVDYPEARLKLADALLRDGQHEEASFSYDLVIRAEPKNAEARWKAAQLARGRGDVAEALKQAREAVRLRPELGEAQNFLGAILCDDKQDYHAAIAAFRAAIAQRPDYADAYYNLGVALGAQGEREIASEQARGMRRLARAELPRFFRDFALVDNGEMDEAIAAFREAARLNPDRPDAWLRLSHLLGGRKKDHEGAVEALKRVVHLKPEAADHRYSLGLALGEAGLVDEAIAAYREAIRLRPGMAEAHCNLGILLRSQGRFDDALSELKRGHDLGTKSPKWPYRSADWIGETERQAARDRRLPAVLSGEEEPGGLSERIAFARLCAAKGLFAASARMFQALFGEHPAVVADRDMGLRNAAAKVAARAGTGAARDDPPPDEESRSRLRRQALEWLTAELEILAIPLEAGPALGRHLALRRLQGWLRTPELAGLRRGAALAALPIPDREAWSAFWDRVDGHAGRASEGIQEARRGELHARAGRWSEAAGALERSARALPGDSELRRRLTLILLRSGEMKAARLSRDASLERFKGTNDPDVALSVARTVALTPDPGVDRKDAVVLAELALRARPGDSDRLIVLGLALHRAGEFDQALRRLDEAVKAQRTSVPNANPLSPQVWPIMAIVQARLGRADEASLSFNQAKSEWERLDRIEFNRPESAYDDDVWTAAEFDLLAREAGVPKAD